MEPVDWAYLGEETIADPSDSSETNRLILINNQICKKNTHLTCWLDIVEHKNLL